MATTSDLHIHGIDVEITNFSKTLAESAIEWPVVGSVVSAVHTCRKR